MIQMTLIKKQEIIYGTCPTGSSIRAINPNGSVVCESVNAGGTVSGEPSIYTVTVSLLPGNIASGNYSSIITLECPTGFYSTGYGFNGFDIDLVYVSPTAHNQYTFQFKNKWL